MQTSEFVQNLFPSILEEFTGEKEDFFFPVCSDIKTSFVQILRFVNRNRLILKMKYILSIRNYLRQGKK